MRRRLWLFIRLIAVRRPAVRWTKPPGATTVQVTCAGGGRGGGYADRSNPA